VIGSTASGNGVGAATSNSRVPCQRCRCSAPLAEVAIEDQVPMTAAPSPAYTRAVRIAVYCGDISSAQVAKNSGIDDVEETRRRPRRHHLQLQATQTHSEPQPLTQSAHEDTSST
jgi:hypothetical protein